MKQSVCANDILQRKKLASLFSSSLRHTMAKMNKYIKRKHSVILVGITFLAVQLLSRETELSLPPKFSGSIAAKISYSSTIKKTAKGVVTDTLQKNLRPLTNEFLLGTYNLEDAAVPSSSHEMDAVVIASAADAAVAICVHNLYHLLGFRRFFFIVNDISECPSMLDLLPQHNGQSQCLEHAVFYNEQDFDLIQSTSVFPKIHQGGPIFYTRGGKKVQVPKMGWHLQQFSKFLVGRKVADLSKQYLVIDGDIIFTRPFELITKENKVILPESMNKATPWEKITSFLLGESDDEQSDDSRSFVIGWMVLDRLIVDELIEVIDRKLTGPQFPMNVLYLAEERIDNKDYFSEFYTYARFALENHREKFEIFPAMGKVNRNQGINSTCVLSKEVYQASQENLAHAPYLVWEEHKYHIFHACPNGEDNREVSLQNVAFWHDFHPPPWGGGNQFLLALRYGLEKLFDITVVAKNDENGLDLIQKSSQVLLANSVTFGGNTAMLEQKKAISELAFVHRVDGPYYVAHYSRPLDAKIPEIPKEDQQTKNINDEFACATVFQSLWSWQANNQIGLHLRNPVLVPNTVNPTIFHPPAQNRKINGHRIKIVASSHSANHRKGFDTLLYLDAHLDGNRFELTYMGGIPKDGSFNPKNLHLWKEQGSGQVANFLQSGDIYLAPSHAEPASNAVLEALSCGLPVLYQKGSSHGELVGAGGLGFENGPDLLEKLDVMVTDYELFVSRIQIPTLEEVTRQYLSIMRWCFYMRHTII